MPITYSAAYTNYSNTRYDLIRWLEEPGGVEHLTIYKDSNGYATIGAGFLIYANIDFILSAMGLPATAANAIRTAVTVTTTTVVNGVTKTTVSNRVFTSDADAQTAINTALRQAANNNTLNFLYADRGQVQTTFDTIVENYERIVDAFLPAESRPVDNRERLALLSLAYNGMLGKKPNGSWVSPSLRKAFIDGDRAEAWFQMRYNSNPEDLPGVAKRRYYESSLFGLYADRENPTRDEAYQAFRSLQLHRGKIIDYEKKHGLWVDASGTYTGTVHSGSNKQGPIGFDLANGADYAGILGQLPVGHAENILESLTPAKSFILTSLKASSNTDITAAYAVWEVAGNAEGLLSISIYLDPGRKEASQAINPDYVALLDARIYVNGAEASSNDLLIGESTLGKMGDLLLGGRGNDLLIGGDGDDVLWGGEDNDVMAGGAGNDTYIIVAGDGTDTIEDKLGNNRVILNGKAISLLIKQADGTMASPDGLFTAYIDGTDLVVTDVATGTKTILNKDFQDGDFGIHLRDALVTPETTRTIVGDLAFFDSDPSEAGIQTQTDELGNTVRDPGQAEPDRKDFFYDSTGNDLIRTFGGDDWITANRGGDDQIEGGTGQDRIEAGDGGDLITGGEGADIVNGGAGNDRLYANDIIEIGAAIERGDTVQGTGQKGDWLNGSLGDDDVIGGDDNDVLFGGGGNDLIIGGAGDDVINAGDDYTAVSFNWTVTTYGNPFDRSWWPVSAANFDSDSGGNDQIYGGNGADVIFGIKGNDYLDGGGDNDTLVGCDDDDILFGGAGADLMTGDYGSAAYDSGSGQVVQGNDYLDGGEGDDLLQGEGGSDDLFGGTGNDTLYGDASYLDGPQQGADYLDGEVGDDLILGQGSDDVLYGGDGNDTLNGDDDGLALAYHGNDELYGEGGNDIMLGGAGNDVLSGDDGDDTLFGDGSAAQDSNGNDALDGGAGSDYLDGQGGDDYLDGGSGQDTLVGGGGNDEMSAGSEADGVYGGDGDDYLDGEDGGDVLSGDAGNDEVFGGTGTDRLFGVAGTDYLDGEDGNDELQGGDEGDTLLGGAGDDLVIGDSGNDTLDGEDGNDELQGGSGADTLYGGADNDRLYGQGYRSYAFIIHRPRQALRSPTTPPETRRMSLPAVAWF